MIQLLRSVAFIIQMYVAMLIISVAYFPWAVISAAGAHAACHAYCRWVIWTLGWMTGLRCEVRGTPPTDDVMIAAKHQSFLDILMIYNAVPRGKFIMKRELLFAPFVGQYGLRIGCVPVNRGKRGAAIAEDAIGCEIRQASGWPVDHLSPRHPRAPGVPRPYKVGTGALYEQLGQPCVPVAANVGVFWPRHSLLRKPGLAVVEFLPRIAPGMQRDAFMRKLEDDVETASNRLMAEAGFHADH